MKRRKRKVRKVLRTVARRTKRRNPSTATAKKLDRAIAKLSSITTAQKQARKVRKKSRTLRISNWRRVKSKVSRMSVKRTRSGLMRSPYSRVGYHKGVMLRVNPYRRTRRKRRNPMAMIKRTMGQFKLNQALPILVGFAGGIYTKKIFTQNIVPMLPISNPNTILMINKWSGLFSMVIGAFAVAKGKKQMVKSAGLGMIVGGIYDILGSNFMTLPFVNKLVSTIPSGSSEAVSGLNLYRGSNFDVVGASNLSDNPEIVGEMDFDDMDI